MDLQHGLEEVRTGGYTAVNFSESPLNAHNMLTPLYNLVKYYGKFNMKKTQHLSADFPNHPTENFTMILLQNSEKLPKGNQIEMVLNISGL